MAGFQNFNFQGQVPMASIVQAYLQKAQTEQQARQQKQTSKQQAFQNAMQAVQTGSQAVSQMVQNSVAKREQALSDDIAAYIGKSEDMVPGPEKQVNVFGKPAPVAQAFTQTAGQIAPVGPPMQRLGGAPEYKAELASMIAKRFPKEYAIQALQQTGDTRGKISGRDIQQFYLVSPDGTDRIPVRYDEVSDELTNLLSGQPIDRQLYTNKGYQMARSSPQVRTDEFGRLVSVEPTTGSSRSIATPAQGATTKSASGGLLELRAKAPKVYEDVQTQYQKAFPENNKFLETMVYGASSAAQVKSLLQAPTSELSQVGLQSLGFYFARMAGSNSQLSDREREVFEAPLALVDKVANKGYRLVKGDLSPKMKSDLLRLATTLEKKSFLQAQKIVAGTKKRAKAISGTYWNKSLEAEFPTVDELIVSTHEMGAKGSPVDALVDLLKGGK